MQFSSFFSVVVGQLLTFFFFFSCLFCSFHAVPVRQMCYHCTVCRLYLVPDHSVPFFLLSFVFYFCLGYYENQLGSSGCANCTKGKYRINGNAVAQQCNDCPIGFYQNEQSSSFCVRIMAIVQLCVWVDPFQFNKQ